MMTESLKHDLEKLLETYPELKNANLSFTETSAAYTDVSPNQSPLCQAVTEPKPIIKGASPLIEVRRSKVHGYGVFANTAIPEGTEVEQCKLLKMGLRQKYQYDRVLNDYFWANGNCNCDECKTHGYNAYIALGFGSLYNHAEKPNTRQDLNFTSEVLTVTTNRDIHQDEELFLNYGNKYFLIRDFMKKVRENGTLEKKLQERALTAR